MKESHWDLILQQIWTFFLFPDTFLWILYFFIGFVSFSRFCKFAMNILICVWYQLICLLSEGVLCLDKFIFFSYTTVNFRSVFSARLTKCAFNIICYLHKIYLQGSIKGCLKCFSSCKGYSFACTEPSLNFIKAWNRNKFQKLFAFCKGMLISLRLISQTNALSTLSWSAPPFLLYLEMPCNQYF